MNFFEKFFGYYLHIDGEYKPFDDGLAGGSFADWRHFIWVVGTPILSVWIYRHYRKHPSNARKAIMYLASILLGLRLIFQILKVTYGDEIPFWRIVPFHQCAVMGIVLPLVVLFNLKNLKMPIYTISMMGGFATIAFGEYFTSKFITFYSIEGIISHTFLIIIPLIEIASGKFSLDIKKSWSVFVGMLVLMGWASLGNFVFFRNYNTNYMFLRKSGFPNGFGGDYYFLLYVVIFLLVFLCIFIPPIVYKNSKKKVALQ